MPSKIKLRRRSFLQQSAIAAAAATVLPQIARGQASVATPADKLLFVFTGTGGASMADSFMAVREGECSAGVRDDMIVYPDAMVTEHGSGPHALRSLNLPPTYRDFFGFQGNGYAQSTFLDRHLADTVVMASEVTSVNHLVAQHRSMTGHGAGSGKSLGEIVAERYGQSLALPYVNMGKGGFLNPGTDGALSDYARAESVSQPIFFPLSGDGVRGVVGAPGAETLAAAPQLGGEMTRARQMITRAREVRNELDKASTFGQTFQCADSRRAFLSARGKTSIFEDASMVTNLMLLRPEELDVTPFGLSTSPDADFVRDLVETATPEGGPSSVFLDSFHAQIALAYLLAKNGYTSSMTLGPDLNPAPEVIPVNPPGSFDFSHQNHVAAQSVMWSRLLDGIDKLVQLLKATPTDDGGTLWDRSLIYVATDFGRDKRRSEPGAPIQMGTSTAHHLNNGTLLLSPLLNGGRRYGTMDADTVLTSGFDRETGEPDGSTMREADVYSVICQALGVDFLGRADIPCMMRDA